MEQQQVREKYNPELIPHYPGTCAPGTKLTLASFPGPVQLLQAVENWVRPENKARVRLVR